MGFGHDVDLAAGWASRHLHGLRGPKNNTVSELTPYLDLTTAELNPEPPALTDVRVHDTLVSNLLSRTTLSWRRAHQILSPAYRARHDREYRATDTVWARWLRPDGTRRKDCLIYVPGWLEPGSWIEEAFVFPRFTRELNLDVLHVALPFHGPRNPRSALFSGEYFWTADLVRSFEAVRQALFDTRAAMGWARRQGYERVGVSGISLGGSLTMLLACLDPVPDYIIPIVAHLRLAEAVENASILWRMKRDLERFGIHEAERRRIFTRLGFDSATPLLPPDRQLWVEAREDAHIDPKLVQAQWEERGRPPIHWISGGHMTFPLHLAEITRSMRDFLDRNIR